MIKLRFCIPICSSLFAVSAFIIAGLPAQAALTVFSASGPDAASIQATVDGYRAALGSLNPNVNGSFGSGRREVNWDGVPDNFSDPNLLPGNFFNANSPRGVEFSTPGGGFLVSADSNNPTSTAPRFGFPVDFVPFSNQRLFTPIASVITDVSFFVPGSANAARTNGFGVIFSDVELANLSSLELFGSGGTSLGSLFAPVSGNGGLSFLGVIDTDGSTIESVRITTGDQLLLSNGNTGTGTDLVVMDDFIYGEPVGAAVVPEVGSLALALPALGCTGIVLRRRSRK